MKRFKYDMEARIRFWVEARNEEEAEEMLQNALQDAGNSGLKIDPDFCRPEDQGEIDED